MTEDVELPELVLLSDEPTPDHDADGLGMRPYAEVIARGALGTRGPFTIGVFGKWGEGKTSVLRQARSLITQAGEGHEAAAITVWFNAWQYDHELYPLVPLALAIAEAVDRAIPDDEKYGKAARWITLREIGSALRAVAAGLTVKTPILDLSGKEILAEWDRSSSADVSATLGSSVYQRAFTLLRQASTIGLDREDESRRPPIVVFIDDLDRCTPERALRLLQSVRLVLGQPGFLFVLALDRDPIVHYLAREYEKLKMDKPDDCARDYLGKMIQLPLWIPPHAGRFAGFLEKLLERDELKDQADVRKPLEQLRGLLQVGTDANPRAVVRLVNSLIADRILWAARKGLEDVDADWLGLCAVSRVLRDKIGVDRYRILVRADRFCERLVSAESADDLRSWKREIEEKGAAGRTSLEEEERKLLEPIGESAALRALLETDIGRKWLTAHRERREIDGYLAAEQHGSPRLETEGGKAIENAIRRELSLDEDEPITEAHQNVVQRLDLFRRSIGDEDLPYLALMTSLTELNLGGTQVTDAGLAHLQSMLLLTSVNLWQTQVTDAGLEHLRGLTSLTSLGLVGTQVTNAGMEHLKGLTSLTSLYLSGTQVADAGMEHLKGLTSLTFLGLANTQVTDAGMEHLKGLTSLTSLSLANTEVTDAGMEHLKGLTSLTSLGLSDTEVTDAGMEQLSGMTSLETLDLDGTRVTDAGLEHLKEMTALTALVLWGTQVTDVGLDHLKKMRSLTSLYLGQTHVTDAGLEHLESLTSLNELWLDETVVTGSGFQYLEDLTALTSLHLGETQVTDVGLADVARMTSLGELDLAGTRVTDAGLAHLKGMRSLHWLNLARTQVTDAGLDNLRNLTSLAMLVAGSTQVTDVGARSLEAAILGLRVLL